jgi:NADPH-dependent 2,4-dienoyl-CoA reductase/sulfur reductase-like enzyme
MGHGISRRRLLASLAAAGLGSVLAPVATAASARARIVIVGGGFGGATAARFLARLLPDASVTLVEAAQQYVACPFSNLVIAGLRELPEQIFTYDRLRKEGLNVAHATATDVDTAGRKLSLSTGSSLAYDRLILSPGIDIRWGGLEGYSRDTAERLPHAWKAGAQTLLLRDQLQAMPDGGVVLMSVTAAPFRCPPGPYERASLIAHYLKNHKPRSRLIVLDSNDRFSKQPLFLQAWATHYSDILEWRSASDFGRVSRVDAGAMRLHTDFDAETGDVINVVPPQKAGEIADRAGVTDATGWCPIDAVSFESTLVSGVHVLGDAAIAAPMPKSAFSANQQAKVCAIQVARMLSGLEPEPTTLANTCYSYTTDLSAISVSGVYSSAAGRFNNVPGAGGISPMLASDDFRWREGRQAADWFRAITGETFF